MGERRAEQSHTAHGRWEGVRHDEMCALPYGSLSIVITVEVVRVRARVSGVAKTLVVFVHFSVRLERSGESARLRAGLHSPARPSRRRADSPHDAASLSRKRAAGRAKNAAGRGTGCDTLRHPRFQITYSFIIIIN